MIDLANCSFTLAVRQVLEVSIGAGLERLQGVARTGAACVDGLDARALDTNMGYASG